MAVDIGVFLFKDILKMMEYPGAPFSGIIINDLVMFFLIPTIFIILVIYMAVGRVVAGHAGLRLLVGLGAYLFIIFGGYFGVFARIAGPYFIFLIFILGLLYFLLEHFSPRAGYSSGGGYSGGNSYPSQRYDVDAAQNRSPSAIEAEIRTIRTEMDRLMKDFKANKMDEKSVGNALQGFSAELARLSIEATRANMNLNPIRKLEGSIHDSMTRLGARR